MVIFHSYVKLPEGTWNHNLWSQNALTVAGKADSGPCIFAIFCIRSFGGESYQELVPQTHAAHFVSWNHQGPISITIYPYLKWWTPVMNYRSTNIQSKVDPWSRTKPSPRVSRCPTSLLAAPTVLRPDSPRPPATNGHHFLCPMHFQCKHPCTRITFSWVISC